MRRNKYKNLKLGDKKTLAKKIGFTVLMIGIFKLLGFIPSPFINTKEMLEQMQKADALNIAKQFSGQALSKYTLMATGTSAYINASIVLQLLTYAFPRLNEIQKSINGEKVMKRITMVLGVMIAIITSLGITFAISSSAPEVLANRNWTTYMVIALWHALGTFIAIMIGESIDKKGYGNGLSILIVANIVPTLPALVASLLMYVSLDFIAGLIIIAILLLMFKLIVLVDSSERKVPVSYTKIAARGIGQREQKQTLPLKINFAGVMPIIFASSILQIINLILNFFNGKTIDKVKAILSDPYNVWYTLVTAILIILFTFLYSKIAFDATEIADSLQKNGGAVLGVRPGLDTRKYFRNINKGLTGISAIYLFIVSMVPILILYLFGLQVIQATSLMILVGVSLDIINKLSNEYGLSKMKF